ncbi:thiamine pyrophosphate-binding protein [Clostridium sp. HCP1S3_B4]|uniref:thiamine pyrophosphate-binding protein n=1 Tax=unclassified Clostridium TaxID=2614128 RepID=UPI003F8A440F
MKKRVADIIFNILVDNGIYDCFGVVGGGAMHLDNALALNNKINKYFNHHEQASAMAAESYARLNGRMAAVCVTAGPGGTNTLTGVMGAWQDSIPMIVISGQVRYETTIENSGLKLRYRGLQEFDIINSVKNMTKYAVMINDPLSIKREVQKAIDIAMDGRRGPVWIDVPLDVQSAIVEESELYSTVKIKSLEVVPNDNEIDEINNIIKKAKRPCILAGSGIRSSNSMSEFLKFLEIVKIPIVGGSWVADILYHEHDLYYGLCGNVGPRTGNFIIQNADVILVLGNSLGFRQTGFNQKAFAPKSKIIMVDIDENESKKPGLNIYRYVKCDLKKFFKKYEYSQLIEAPNKWISYCENLNKRFSRFEGAEGINMNDRVSSYYFWKKFMKYEPDDSILALGNNTANTAKLQIGTNKKNQRVLTNYTCGSMGYDLPAAIGAAVASNKEVFCITGDGSIMMNLQELQTIKYYDLKIKIIVFSNDGYGAIRQTCKNFFNGKYIGCTKDTGVSFPNLEKVADTFDFKYLSCNTNNEVEESIRKLMEINERCILEIKQRYDDPVTPKVMSRIKEDGTFETPSLEDMYPFLDKEELDKLMISN